MLLPSIANRQSAIGNSPAFSLIEIMVVVGLLSVIMLGLLAMFNQTQRAFRVGLNQVDVLEAGRAATDLITRELQEIAPANGRAVNFYAFLPQILPLTQPLPGSPAVSRRNLAEDMFFLVHENQSWTGIGYRVWPSDATVGTLYRYTATNGFRQDPALLFNGKAGSFLYTHPTNLNYYRPVMGGVVHFRVRTFDTNSTWLTAEQSRTNMVIQESLVARGEIGLYQFFSNAVPAFVELEIGILEERTLRRANAITNSNARRKFLENQAARVHLFRQRVPIRNVDPSAYQ